MGLSPVQQQALAQTLDAIEDVTVERAEQLSGGASRQTYEISAVTKAGVSKRFILQREAEEPRREGGLADESVLIEAARRAGVPTATVVVANGDAKALPELGASFVISEAIEGETIARRILRQPALESARRQLSAQLGRALGLLHTQVDASSIHWLEAVDPIEHYRAVADEIGIVSPSFELAFAWLEQHRNHPTSPVVVHGDFRLGNLIVDESGLAAVIDWELAHLGDPMEDLGWLCVRAWRFGGSKPVAGVGERAELFDAYADIVGKPVDPTSVHWWEVMGTLKWGIMCAIQADRHLSGSERSVELVSIGPRLAEQEYDVINLIKPPSVPANPVTRAPEVSNAASCPTGGAEGGGRPSAADLLDAVQDFLTNDLSDVVDQRVKFHGRVAANAIAIARRDQSLAGSFKAENDQSLIDLGFNSERSMAEAIRSGSVGLDSEQGHDIWRYCFASVVRRLEINNPKWLV